NWQAKNIFIYKIDFGLLPTGSLQRRPESRLIPAPERVKASGYGFRRRRNGLVDGREAAWKKAAGRRDQP
ncbi:hypothetical protein, partial [Devosia sp.]|uniref:hypothetical protein n=1 Tax=Devosia sp. TaxID=1871048 RepID=UPI002B0031DE